MHKSNHKEKYLKNQRTGTGVIRDLDFETVAAVLENISEN